MARAEGATAAIDEQKGMAPVFLASRSSGDEATLNSDQAVQMATKGLVSGQSASAGGKSHQCR